MNITKLIKDIMTEKNIKITQLNDMLNAKNNTNYTPQNLGKRLNKEDIKFSDAEEILNILGYSIEIIPNKHLENIAINKANIEVGGDDISDLLAVDSETSPKLCELFGGNSKLDEAIDRWFDKYIEQRIEFKAKDYFDKIFPSQPIRMDDKPDLLVRKYIKEPDKEK